MNAATVGTDLPKKVFSIHAVEEQGKVVMRSDRAKLVQTIATLPRCLIGMEGSSGPHD